MFGRVFAIALNTYRESVRARILIGLAGVAFAFAFYSLIVGAFTLKNAPRVVSDLGAASISLFSVAVAILIGATSLHRELEQKTIFPILARPIGRGEYLTGKYLGTLLTIAVFILADAGLVLLLSAALGGRPFGLVAGTGGALVAALGAAAWRWPAARTFGPIPWAFALCAAGAWLAGVAPDERRVVLGASALALMEVGIIAAVATLFSSFSTPFLSSLLTIGVFLVGRSADTLARLPVKQFGEALHDAGETLSRVVPNLQIYVPPRPLLTGEAIDAKLFPYLGMAALTCVGWAVGLLAVATFIFKKRDFL
jgi:ABC-type transport system involved in multi-copper enzyme maturation permease subunit